MSMTDPVADFLTRLRNAAKAQHHDVTIPSSKLKRELARILAEQGYIEGWEVRPPEPGRPGERLTVTLKYTSERRPVITGMQRVSRPGQRTYVDHAHIPRIQGGMGTAIISTSKGVMTGHEARRQGIGGEVVARVW
ncbi:MAG: 30S ribosomal protein S8 [Solirubrobacterales bacterium]|nr:30S ribosomal protein S8 [Solirubrobacterales bacterium]MBV9836935.1 30S ribosomal protein S8 [Solirubrobacterales bacterium]